MPRRRTVLTSVGGIAALSAAGCLDIVQDGVDATAEPAKTPESTAEEYGYTFETLESIGVDETVSVADIERDIDVTSWIAQYTKDAGDLDLADHVDEDAVEDLLDHQAAVFGVVSTPSVTIVGEEVNPVGRLSDAELLEEFNNELIDGTVSDLDEQDDQEVSLLGDTVALTTYTATLQPDEDEEEYDIRIHVAETTHEDDIIVAAGAAPTIVDEQSNITALINAVEHPVDTPAPES